MRTLPQDGARVNGARVAGKSTIRTESAEKAPSRNAVKRPLQREKQKKHHKGGKAEKVEKAPSYYIQCALLGVCGVDGLRVRLTSYAQGEWCKVRAYGLLILVSWFCRHGSKPARIGAGLARQYVSPIKRRKHRDTIQEPLLLLCKIGILERTAPAVFAHVRLSAEYRIAPDLAGKIHRFTELLPPSIAHKLKTADERKERRLDATHKFRKPLLADLARLRLADAARPILAGMQLTKTGGSGLQNIVAAIDGRMHKISVDSSGTITTTISSFPRELKPHLTIDGEPAVSCDVSHMHHCLLPRLLFDRINHARAHHPGTDLSAMQGEHKRFVAALSGPDYYRSWCNDPTDDDERAKVKREVNTVLNMPNRTAQAIPLYQRMKRAYPYHFRTIESIKRDDHRNVGKQLRRFTSNAINGALGEIKNEGIAAIPQTDAILCRERDQKRVREIIGKHVFRESSGVRCKVNGILTTP